MACQASYRSLRGVGMVVGRRGVVWSADAICAVVGGLVREWFMAVNFGRLLETAAERAQRARLFDLNL